MPNDNNLFAAFPPVSPEQWIQQAISDLKGADFRERLQYTAADGITVQPFYTEEDLAKLPQSGPLFTHTDWEICEVIEADDAVTANGKALHALDNGATALLFRLAPETDPGMLMQGIMPQYIDVQFRVAGALPAFADQLRAWVQSNGVPQEQLRIGINADFIAHLAQTGRWQEHREADAAAWTKLFTDTAPYRTLCIDAAVYHNAGASPAYQLGCALAQLHEYLTLPGIQPEATAGRIQVNVATGPDYFFEISKLRALRKVFALLLETYGADTQIYIHAETAYRNLTAYDAYNNLLRTTTEAMAAVIGGCNSLSVTPFDAVLRSAHEFPERMARNIQLILKEESYFSQVSDVSAGAYFIETLTEQLAEKAWDYFREIERRGGLISCLLTGSIQETVKGFAQQEQERFATGTEVLVGVNKYPNPNERLRGEHVKIAMRYSTPAPGAIVEPLDTDRLAATQEAARLAAEKEQL